MSDRSGAEPDIVSEQRALEVLLVSDNDDFRADVDRAFRAAGDHVYAFRSPREVADAQPIPRLDVGIVDYTFDEIGETGLSMVDQLHASNRHFPVIVTSCHWTPHLGAECGRRWATFCLRKRCTGPEVVAIAHEVVYGERDADTHEAPPRAPHKA